MIPLLLAAVSLAPAGGPPASDGGPVGAPDAAPAAPAEDAPTYLLRYRFTAGESLRNEITTAATIDSTVQGTRQTVHNAGTTTQRMDVLPLPADAAPGTAGVLRVHSERVRLSAQFDANPPTTYDSASSDPVPDGYQAVDRVAKAPLGELTVSELGEVTHAKSLLPGMEDLDAEAAAAAYHDLFPRLPEGEVALGQSWVQKVKVRVTADGLPTPWLLRRRSTLTKVKDGVATIAVKITPLPPTIDPIIQEQLAMKCPAGLIEFDVAKGRIVSLRAEVDEQILGIRGAGSLLRLRSLHYQTLTESGPTATMTAPRTAAVEAPAVR